ncbi:cupin domain-containing protein [Sphingobium sp. JS3065]|jgi:predicted cupin superfamily sugar epimerase|uniref:cupin domain-containing protein n=1 Tax=Sphingobium sp. JS3065 TaxID=2970925 RepID=UPI0022653CFB|nr:cupin domain-containing protein [Sphingobium sp. JS3065]UZW53619.1 cupin domain-containing protein [Sphingobium sp. JS3065]
MSGYDETGAKALIRSLDLAPHPEGGWYRECWRAKAEAGERAAGTTIYFLLEAHQRSHWHRVDADEHWFWHAGAPMTLSIAAEGGPVREWLLGGDVLAGQQPQLLVPSHHWQAARPVDGWTLVSCVVIPGFEFSGFALAPDGWSPGG